MKIRLVETINLSKDEVEKLREIRNGPHDFFSGRFTKTLDSLENKGLITVITIYTGYTGCKRQTDFMKNRTLERTLITNKGMAVVDQIMDKELKKMKDTDFP